MSDSRLATLLSVLVTVATTTAAQAEPAAGWVLRYDRPANEWVEALPVGNGAVGSDGFRPARSRTDPIQQRHALGRGAARLHPRGRRGLLARNPPPLVRR